MTEGGELFRHKLRELREALDAGRGPKGDDDTPDHALEAAVFALESSIRALALQVGPVWARSLVLAVLDLTLADAEPGPSRDPPPPARIPPARRPYRRR